MHIYIYHIIIPQSRGAPPKIPPFSPLVFDIEIHEVKGGKGKPQADARAAFEKAKI